MARRRGLIFQAQNDRLGLRSTVAGAMVSDDPVELDEHRGMAAQKATEIRRRLSAVLTEQAALRQHQAELEAVLFAAPATTWPEAAAKARYLIELFAATSEGRDSHRQKLIASVLEDLAKLSDCPPRAD